MPCLLKESRVATSLYEHRVVKIDGQTPKCASAEKTCQKAWFRTMGKVYTYTQGLVYLPLLARLKKSEHSASELLGAKLWSREALTAAVADATSVAVRLAADVLNAHSVAIWFAQGIA